MSAHHASGTLFTDNAGLAYGPRDACGVGFIARQSGERTHEVVTIALEASARLARRGASSADSSAALAAISAGMSNGVAYLFDEADTFASRLNHEMVLSADLDHDDTELLSRLLQLHQQRTNSARARWLLDGWDQQLPRWRKVKPRGSAKSAAGGRSAWIGCWRSRWRGRARAAAVRGWTMVNEQPDREFARIFADGIGVPSGVVEQHQSRTFALCLHPRAFASIRGEAVCC